LISLPAGTINPIIG